MAEDLRTQMRHVREDYDEIVLLLNAKIPILEKSIDKLDNAIYGKNGEPGLLYWTRRNKERLDDINKVLWLVLSTGVGAIILQVLNLIHTP